MAEIKTGPTMYPRSWQTVKEVDHSTSKNPTFSVMTYNILNDTCIPDGLYDYCDKSIRFMPQRYLHIKEEIKHFDPDIVCMQEINMDQYKTLIQPIMEAQGFGCVVSGRAWYQERHMDAIFYKKDIFTMQTSESVTLYDAIKDEIKDTELSDLTRAALQKHLMLSHQVVLTQLLHLASSTCLYVACTHIYWGDLQAPDVQAAQVCAGIRCLQNFMKGATNPCYILAGDFNAPPGWPTHQMISDTGKPNAKSLNVLRQPHVIRDDGEEICLADAIPEVLDINLKLKSSYKHVLGDEVKTTSCSYDTNNVVCTYSLDYIWFGPDNLEVTAVLQPPPDDAIMQETALPSSLFPSDHVPMMAKFVIKS